MSPRSPSYIDSRAALLDALDALGKHGHSLVLVGAQAIYLYTGEADVPVATETKDSDVMIDPQNLAASPKIEDAMAAAKFSRNLETGQPGEWLSPSGVPVDLLVPETLAGEGGRRGARIPPHSKSAARRVLGLEAAIIDNQVMEVGSLVDDDTRSCSIKVAGPTALLIAKLHKVGERQASPTRLLNKDAHDMYRLMRAVPSETFQAGFALLIDDPAASAVTRTAIAYLEVLFDDPGSLGPRMAGDAETNVGDPGLVSAAAHALAQDLLAGAKSLSMPD